MTASNWSICKTCGAKVYWTDRADMDRRIPLVPTGETGWVLRDDRAEAHEIWQRHLCRVEDIKAWEATAEAREEEERKRQEFRDQRTKTYQKQIDAYNAELWKLALTVPCPKCKAQVDQKCTSLVKGKINYENKRPHKERLRDMEVPLYPAWSP